MLGCAFRHASPAPSHLSNHIPHHGIAVSRKISLAYAQHVTTTPPGTTGDGKPVLQVQVTRPSLPCEKPLPLANVLEVQRLLFLLEAPEYCMRAFREHGVNGQDLLHMEESDLEDSRFKFPKHVQRKVMRIAQAWQAFQDMTESPTQGSVTMEQCVGFYARCCSPASAPHLQSAFRALDVNNNGNITFEEFLVGYSLLEAAVNMARKSRADASGPTSTSSSGSDPASSSAPVPCACDTAGSSAPARTSAATPVAADVPPAAAPAAPEAAAAAAAAPPSSDKPTGGFTSSLASWFQL